jgi:hypothetical protein
VAFPRKIHKPLVRIIVLLLVLTSAASSSLAIAQTQEGVQQLFGKLSGPYEITVVASSGTPARGPLYLWITLTDVASKNPVTNADVRIIASQSDKGPDGHAIALHSPVAPGTYTADINLLKAGTWSLSFVITNPPLDEITITTTLEVRESLRDLRTGTFGWIFVILVIVSGACYIWWRARSPRGT